MEVDEETITCHSEITNKFNDFFSNIGHACAAEFNNLLQTLKQLMPNNLFSWSMISEPFVIRELLSMSNSKSTGLEDIAVKLLKLSVHVIGNILTHIINC